MGFEENYRQVIDGKQTFIEIDDRRCHGDRDIKVSKQLDALHGSVHLQKYFWPPILCVVYNKNIQNDPLINISSL